MNPNDSPFITDRLEVLSAQFGEHLRPQIRALLLRLEDMHKKGVRGHPPAYIFVETHLAMTGLIPIRKIPYSSEFFDSVLASDLNRIKTAMRTGLEPPECGWADKENYALCLQLIALKEENEELRRKHVG